MSLGDDLVKISQETRELVTSGGIESVHDAIIRLKDIQVKLAEEARRIPEVFSLCPYQQALALEIVAIDELLEQLQRKEN